MVDYSLVRLILFRNVNGSKPTVPLSSVLDELGITEKELEETEDVAIE